MKCTSNQYYYVALALMASTMLSGNRSAEAQSSSLYRPAQRAVSSVPLTLAETSYTYQPRPERREFHEHDVVTVNVDMKWEATTSGELERKKRMDHRFAITDWIRFNGLSFIPDPMEEGEPAVSAELDQKIKNEGDLERRDTLEFRITCEVASIQDNGLLFLEGTHSQRIGEENKVFSFSGYVRPEDVGPDNIVQSERVFKQTITEIPSGSVYDSHRRFWGMRLLDHVSPF
jgi:flagellar L-ring protein precursor FlgH